MRRGKGEGRDAQGEGRREGEGRGEGEERGEENSEGMGKWSKAVER